MRVLSRASLILMLVSGLGGCAVGPQFSADVCADANAHLSGCGIVDLELSAICDGEQSGAARELLDMSCDELRVVTAEPGKSDFWSRGNPLCGFLAGAEGIEANGLCCFDRNCEGELVCNSYRCVAPGPAGTECGRSDHCAGDLVCTEEEVCGEASVSGEACARSSHCADGLACIAQRCASRAPEGGACDDHEDADCERGLICWEGTCEAERGSGGSCVDGFDCSSGLECVGGACVEQPGAGGACDVGDFGDCDFGLVCIGGECQPEPGLGEACEREPRTMCGFENTCWDGVCEPRHGLSGPCEDLFDCADRLFCIEGRCMP